MTDSAPVCIVYNDDCHHLRFNRRIAQRKELEAARVANDMTRLKQVASPLSIFSFTSCLIVPLITSLFTAGCSDGGGGRRDLELVARCQFCFNGSARLVQQ